MVLTLLAIPISRLRPRQGRYARVWLGVLIYFVYSNLVSAGKVWLARGKMPEEIGLWWVHLAVVLLGLSLLWVPRIISRARYRSPA
jgi:lipopolysaccharide export system permease protein